MIAAPVEVGMLLLVAQTRTFVLIIDDDCRETAVPFFASAKTDSTPARELLRVRLLVNDITELPDVVAYNTHMRAASEIDEHYRLFLAADEESTRVPLPTNYFLPGTLVAGERESAIVYSLRSYLAPQVATVEVHNSDSSVVPTVGSRIMRRCMDWTGEILERDVGMILGSAEL